MNLPRVLPQNRHSMITQVELVWSMDPCGQLHKAPSLTPLTDLASFNLFLESISVTFASVRSLYLSIQGILFPWLSANRAHLDSNARFTVTEELIMQPLDNMVRNLGSHVCECSIAIPSSMYVPRRIQAEQSRRTRHKVERTLESGKLERHWRPLENSKSLPGYWVRLGQRDKMQSSRSSVSETMAIMGADPYWILNGEW